MKTIVLLATGLSLTASAQNTPFVHEVVRKTNVANVAASGVIAAHQIVTVADIAQVGVIQNGQFRAFDQPAIGIVSVTTNLLDKVPARASQAGGPAPKPLLSAPQQLGTRNPKPGTATNKPAPKIAGPAPPPPNTNSPAYRRSHKLPP